MPENEYTDLASAIILQAVEDYAISIIQDDLKTEYECKSFFGSKWFNQINWNNVDSGLLMKKARRAADEFVDNSIETINQKFISKRKNKKYRAFKCPFCGGNVYSIYTVMHKKAKSNGDKTYGYRLSCDSCFMWLKHPDKIITSTGIVKKIV